MGCHRFGQLSFGLRREPTVGGAGRCREAGVVAFLGGGVVRLGRVLDVGPGLWTGGCVHLYGGADVSRGEEALKGVYRVLCVTHVSCVTFQVWRPRFWCLYGLVRGWRCPDIWISIRIGNGGWAN